MREGEALRLLYGTDEPPAGRRVLRAGPLSAVLEAGNLRDMRFGGVEVLRGVAFLVRDADWGTLPARPDDVTVEEEGGRFRARYRARAGEAGAGLAWGATIEASADGEGSRLAFAVEGRAEADFRTNRTGFVVLHPLRGVAGREMRVGHTDGSTETVTIPETVAPDQPVFDIRSLAHEPVPGLEVSVGMTGDAYEMEDQRNWTDASFKTYIRPLSKPRPYVLEAGSAFRQEVVVRVAGAPGGAAEGGAAGLAIGGEAGAMPAIGLGLDRADVEAARAVAPAVAGLAPQFLSARVDAAEPEAATALGRAARLAREIRAGLALTAVIDGVSPEEELGVLARILSEAGAAPDSLLPVPRRDLRTRPSHTLPERQAPGEAILAAARRAFPGVRIGGGVPTSFTEFNRNPPPSSVDFIAFGTVANVHAADDASIMETLEAVPHVIASARRRVPGRPLRLGPSGIGMRENPYGAGPAANPCNARVATARRDPRHRALFGAAFTLGLLAASEGVEAVTAADPAGDFGVAEAAAGGFRLFPLFHVLRAAARGAGRPRLAVATPPGLAALAFEGSEGRTLLLANLAAEPAAIDPPQGFSSAAVLDAASAPAASRDPAFLDNAAPLAPGPFALGAFAVARLTA